MIVNQHKSSVGPVDLGSCSLLSANEEPLRFECGEQRSGI